MNRCSNCGNPLPEGTKFCVNCGQPAPTQAPVQQNVAPPPAAGPTPQAVAPPNAGSRSGPARPSYEPRPQPGPPGAYGYAPPPGGPPWQAPQSEETRVLSTGSFFGLILLFALPVIGFISCLIMAFSSKNLNRKHFARAMLIWVIIALVLSLVFYLIFREQVRYWFSGYYF